MQAADACATPRDRVCDWYVEAERVVNGLPSLRPAARRAVTNVLIAIMREEAGATRRQMSVLTAPINEQ